MRKAISYLRFSTPEQEKGDSKRRQATAAVDYATRKGLELDDKLSFQDLGVSAFRGKNAETGALGLFLEAVRSGLVEKGSTLLVESLDRISRQAARKALRVLEAIVEEGITVVTLNDGREYTSENLDDDPMALMIALLTFVRANEESATKSKRLKAAWGHKRDQLGTEAMTSNGPAWLVLDDSGKWRHKPEAVKVVRKVFAEYLKGVGVQRIAFDLNQEGVPTFTRRNGKDAKRWHRSYILRLVQNPAVVGRFVPHQIIHRPDGIRDRVPLPEKAIDDYYPAVIDPETWSRAQALCDTKQSPRRGIHANHGVTNLFASLALCGRCGSSMVATSKAEHRNGRVYRYLVCTKARAGDGCKYTAVRYDVVEAAFLAKAEELLGEVPAGTPDDQTREQLETALGVLEEALETLGEGYQRTHSETLLTKLQEAEQERTEIRQQLVDLRQKQDATTGPLVGKRLADLLADLQKVPLDRTTANAFLRQVFSGVALDVERGVLGFAWRHTSEVSEVVFGWPKGRGKRTLKSA